jgi:hypothetical protein
MISVLKTKIGFVTFSIPDSASETKFLGLLSGHADDHSESLNIYEMIIVGDFLGETDMIISMIDTNVIRDTDTFSMKDRLCSILAS